MRTPRTTFLRQAAHLWAVKQRLQQHVAPLLTAADPLGHVDRMPVHAGPFARAPSVRRFTGAATFGTDHVLRQRFSGCRRHLRSRRAGIIQAAVRASAKAAETEVVWKLAPPAGSGGLGDRTSWSPALREALAPGGSRRLAPSQNQRRAPRPSGRVSCAGGTD